MPWRLRLPQQKTGRLKKGAGTGPCRISLWRRWSVETVNDHMATLRRTRPRPFGIDRSGCRRRCDRGRGNHSWPTGRSDRGGSSDEAELRLHLSRRNLVDYLFTNDRLCLFVSTQSQEHWLTKLVIAGPLGELDLSHQHGLDPTPALHDCRVIV